MIEEVMRYCKNFFIPKEDSAVSGFYTIVDGVIDLSDCVQDGQYFFISGSSFSDGVHQYPCYDLVDETFQGYVTPLAVPQAFINLCNEIEAWQEKYSEASMSPFQSESFGGYSYNKGSAGTSTWQEAFASRLQSWRKL